MEGIKMPNGRYQFRHGVVATSGFLTFVVALHQVRLSDLYVEGFVLLVLFIVDYFHLDGFAEEEEEDQSRNREEKGKRAERVKERTGWKREIKEEILPSGIQASHKGLSLIISCDPDRSSVRLSLI